MNHIRVGPVYFVRDNDSGLSGDLEPPGYSAVIDSWDLPQRRVTPGVVSSKYIVSFEWATPGRTTPLDCSGYEPQETPALHAMIGTESPETSSNFVGVTT